MFSFDFGHLCFLIYKEFRETRALSFPAFSVKFFFIFSLLFGLFRDGLSQKIRIFRKFHRPNFYEFFAKIRTIRTSGLCAPTPAPFLCRF